ncbi:HNH endonuclease [Pleurocapsales cyanobacterium LEGE 10410]|nr:HNH endonuclease [Pleurocapsales cyanobacterium LEGE 10410]
MSSLSCTNPFVWSEVTMMESPMTRNCHVGFGERYEETHQSQDWEVRFVPTPFSPLLANIALHGMENVLGVKYDSRGYSIGKRIIVRYADDFVILCESLEDAKIAKDETTIWLKSRGLQLSEEKTKIIHLTEGFDFLGFNIRHYKVNNTKTGFKLLIKPSKKFLKKTRNDIREIFLNHKGKSVIQLIAAINPVIRGKANYLRKVVSSKAFKDLDRYLFVRQMRYCKRTHPNKPWKWKKKRYWGRFNLQKPNRKWVFGDRDTGVHMLMFSWFNIKRHDLVRQKSSPDDPSLVEYWRNRNKKGEMSEAEKMSRKQEYVAWKQGYKCPVCGESIFNSEPIHLHHRVPRSEGGSNQARNLIWLHLFCHHKVHYQK